jgi:quercetin dioxygenase-like cupin family protein
VVAGLGTAVLAQENAQVPNTPGLTRQNIQRAALAEFPGSDVVTFNAEFVPGGSSGRHRHPGTEVLYVIEGSGVMLRDGREPVQLKPGATVLSEPAKRGESFVHEVRNSSSAVPLRTFIVLVVDEGEPPAVAVN